MDHTSTIPHEYLPAPIRHRHPFETIHVSGFSPAIPFCRDLTGKRMKLGCLENVDNQDCILFVEGTEIRYNLHKNERFVCLLSTDDEFVMAVNRIQYRDGFVFLDSDSMHIIYDGIFRFYRNGMLEFELKDDQKFFFHLSDRGNPFVFADHGLVIDSEGYLKTPDDSYHRYNKWNTHYYTEPFPDEKQYIFALDKGRAGITFDRKVVYEEDYIRGIPDPVVAISLSFAGLWALTTKGQVYLADVKNSLEAVLTAQNAVAISSHCYERYFVFADTKGDLHVYNCSDFCLKAENDRTYLCQYYENGKEYVPKKLHPGRGRISEICVHEGEAAFRCLHGGIDMIDLSYGRSVYKKW